ncbi:MAG: hypothetical protein COB50_00555 [Thiotrichales bacterium]|nr:MAG: hypothetical protein COB50_00555 [Thiotrichales bacterium]
MVDLQRKEVKNDSKADNKEKSFVSNEKKADVYPHVDVDLSFYPQQDTESTPEETSTSAAKLFAGLIILTSTVCFFAYVLPLLIAGTPHAFSSSITNLSQDISSLQHFIVAQAMPFVAGKLWEACKLFGLFQGPLYCLLSWTIAAALIAVLVTFLKACYNVANEMFAAKDADKPFIRLMRSNRKKINAPAKKEREKESNDEDKNSADEKEEDFIVGTGLLPKKFNKPTVCLLHLINAVICVALHVLTSTFLGVMQAVMSMLANVGYEATFRNGGIDHRKDSMNYRAYKFLEGTNASGMCKIMSVLASWIFSLLITIPVAIVRTTNKTQLKSVFNNFNTYFESRKNNKEQLSQYKEEELDNI